MREIKFRAWDGGAMSTPFGLGKEHTSFDDCKSYYKVNKDCDSWVIMQFTGLKDKNGADIYEGDIVRCSSGDSEIVFGCYPTTTDDWGISELSPKFCRKWFDGSGYSSLNDKLEVIGNIYENPELLK